MIVHRVIFQAKFGRANEIVEAFKQMAATQDNPRRGRLYTDLTGSFDTVTMELEYESLAEYEEARAAMFASAQFDDSSARMMDLVEGGRNELYTLEATMN